MVGSYIIFVLVGVDREVGGGWGGHLGGSVLTSEDGDTGRVFHMRENIQQLESTTQLVYTQEYYMQVAVLLPVRVPLTWVRMSSR
jgi:hypothetical protein